jgi:hypothetical protein
VLVLTALSTVVATPQQQLLRLAHGLLVGSGSVHKEKIQLYEQDV